MKHRPRRLRKNAAIRGLVRETTLNINDLICPVFVTEEENIKREIPSMPGQFHFSIDRLEEEINEISTLGIQAVILFGLPEYKDEYASSAHANDGIVQQAVRLIRHNHPELFIITDVCLCQYTSHGHCGIIEDNSIDNDRSVEVLARVTLSHAKAGADMVAPSDMMDGRVKAIREILDNNNYKDVSIMSYSAKYSSAFYGPFREAVSSSPSFGDRKTYQMDPANSDEAIREAGLDLEQGADILMVKPAMAYMDIIHRFKKNFNVPIAAYNVSGEYSMIKAAAKEGFIDETGIMLETITGIKRAGADLIITYFAKDIARWLSSS